MGGGLVYSVMGVGFVLIEVFQQYVRMVPIMRPTMLPMRTIVTMERQNISKLLQGTPDIFKFKVTKINVKQLQENQTKDNVHSYLVREGA